MKVNINFKRIDDSYDQEYADTYNFGDESENNMKYDWGLSYAIENVKEIIVKNDADYALLGSKGNGEKINSSLKHMYLLDCVSDDGTIRTFGASSSAVKNIHKAQRNDVVNYYYYINSNTEFVELEKGLIVAAQDIPEEILKK